MKQILTFSILIVLILSSCKKETFTPCSGLEELYGEWESIDSDVPGYLRLGHKDFFEYRSSVDRDVKKRMTSCFEKSYAVVVNGNLWGGAYGIYLEEDKNNSGYEVISYSIEKDTIMFGAAAFNTSENNNYRQMFVRKK